MMRQSFAMKFKGFAIELAERNLMLFRREKQAIVKCCITITICKYNE